MPDPRFLGVCLHRLAGVLALLSVLTLAACGGGGGAPSGNPFEPPPVTPPAPPALAIFPGTSIVYSGVPSVLTITGGTPPYRAFSSNSTVLPVSQTVNGSSVVLLAGDVASDTQVSITVQDAATVTVGAAVTVRPSTLLNNLSVVANLPECGSNAICSGQTGTASITVQGPGGATVAGRQVRFDVVSGPYSIVTNNPAAPNAATTTVVTDQAGVAQVTVTANVNAPTQPAQLRATDLVSGQQRTAAFTVVQNTSGANILTVVPGSSTITAFFKDTCSAGVPVDYYIYGGTPPYRVTASFPTSITILNSPVTTAGGFFEAITNGQCVDPLTFSILDATGRQTTATLQNLPGSNDRPGPTPIPPLSLAPNSVSAASCTNRTFDFVVSGGGGLRFARVSPRFGTNPTVGGVDGSGRFTVTFDSSVLAAGSSFTVVAGDSAGSTPVTATITCQGGASALNVTPALYDYTTGTTPPPLTCVGKTSNFTITGGTPPYNITWVFPPTAGATITPTTVNLSGQGFSVTGLTDGVPSRQLLITDRENNQATVSISCP